MTCLSWNGSICIDCTKPVQYNQTECNGSCITSNILLNSTSCLCKDQRLNPETLCKSCIEFPYINFKLFNDFCFSLFYEFPVSPMRGINYVNIMIMKIIFIVTCFFIFIILRIMGVYINVSDKYPFYCSLFLNKRIWKVIISRTIFFIFSSPFIFLFLFLISYLFYPIFLILDPTFIYYIYPFFIIIFILLMYLSSFIFLIKNCGNCREKLFKLSFFFSSGISISLIGCCVINMISLLLFILLIADSTTLMFKKPGYVFSIIIFQLLLLFINVFLNLFFDTFIWLFIKCFKSKEPKIEKEALAQKNLELMTIPTIPTSTTQINPQIISPKEVDAQRNLELMVIPTGNIL